MSRWQRSDSALTARLDLLRTSDHQPEGAHLMRQRRTVLSLAAIAVASAGLAIAAPAASAAATLDCDPYWHDDHLNVHCYYGGKLRGSGSFWQEPESLHALDGARDHRAIIAHLSWSQNGTTRHTTLRDAGQGSTKWLQIPEGTKVHLWVCLDGIGCGAKYASYA